MQKKNIVQEVCEELNISHAELAKKLKIGRSSISEWKNGTRKIPNGTLLAMQLLIENNKLKKDLKVIEDFKKMLVRTKN